MEPSNVCDGSTLEAIADYFFLVKGDPDTARKALEQLYMQDPLSPDFAWKLSIVYRRLGRDQEGIALIKKAFELTCEQHKVVNYSVY